MRVAEVPNGSSESARRTPLGCPVVPDEYSMEKPSRSSSSGVGGYGATKSS